MPVITAETNPEYWLLCRVGSRLCALPLATVVETMRLLPIEPLAGVPRFVLGLCIIRGSPVPVVDARTLFGEEPGHAQRLVTVRVEDRVVALAVDGVHDIRPGEAIAAEALPPLLSEAAGDVIASIGTLDAELLVYLRAARIAPEGVAESAVAAGTAP